MYKWPLINDNVTVSDKEALVEFIKSPNVRFTQSEKVREFEQKWSEWLGVKHSVFVNSGASANYIMASVLKEVRGLGQVIVPPLGWVSDIAPLVNLGFEPLFVDVGKNNLSMPAESIRRAVESAKNPVAITLVHALGFNALSDEIIKIAEDNNLLLIEDCCESHGATFDGRKVGSYGAMSNFSFYFGHHMTTIEGGMVCTNDDDLYDLIKMFRSHGMTREASKQTQEAYAERYPDLNPLFTFAVPGYNMRNNELNAVLGIEQLSRLDDNIEKRVSNLSVWLNNLDSERYFTEYDRRGNSNFSLPLILNNPDKNLLDSVCSLLESEGVEYRTGTAGGGNQARQPYLKNYKYKIYNDLVQVNHIHDYALYIGNHTELSDEQIIALCQKLNEL